jgi:2-methylcitrate dehydratase PrpD
MHHATDHDYALDLARFALRATPDNIGRAALDAARTNVFDTLACAVAGSTAQGIAEMRSLITAWGGAPQAHSIVFGDAVPAHHAAWINGAMAHARDYDDAHDAAVLHAGVSVVPAALAAAEMSGGKASGADFIAGVAVGLEAMSRLGVATQIGIVESGYMYTSLFGHFAATLAAARVLRLDEATTVNALGVAYSQVAGNHQVTRDAALTKRMQPGFAAKSALVSVQLAQTGIRAVQNVFEGKDGFFRVYLHNRIDPARLRSGLGETFEFVQLSYKPYPCCRFNHAAIAAALQLRKQHGITPEQIAAVRVGLNHQAYEAVCTPEDIRKKPQTVVQAQFSVPYTVAAALVDGGVHLSHFTDASFARADIQAIAQKVQPYIHAEIERGHGRGVTPALVDIALHGGRVLSLRIDLPLGHPDNPMRAEDFDRKAEGCFQASAIALRPEGHRLLKAAADAIERAPHVGALVAGVCASRD